MRLSGTLFSHSLDMDTGVTVVTPNKLREHYKVVYLLHGARGDHKTWLDYSLLPVFASSGETVYVMPDAARSFYTDMAHGFKYYSYITQELPAIMKNLFNISAKREDTYIMGASMGGYGALKCALSKPEQYGGCAAFSSGNLFLKQDLDALRKYGPTEEFVKTYGEQLYEDFCAVYGPTLEWQEKYELLELVKKAKAGGTLPKLYLSCGNSDGFLGAHERFCKQLDELGVAYTFENRDGGHDFVFFNEAFHRAINHFGL